MSSIRPLVTVIILAAVGAFLYVKINEAPLQPLPTSGAASLQPAAEAVPPLELKASAAAGDQAASPAASAKSVAPAWPESPSANAPTTTAAGGATRTPSPAVPELPPIPDLPPLPGDDSSKPLASLETSQAPPAGVAAGKTNESPGSRYQADPARLDANARADSPADSMTATGPTAEAVSPAGRTEHDAAAENAMAAMGLTPQPTAPAATTPAPATDRPTTTPASSGVDRYGLPIAGSSASDPISAVRGSPPAAGPVPAAATRSARQSFVAAWPAIDAALQKGELARAHQMLSPWHGDPSLSPVEAQQVEKLLGQLAGTVIYSSEHRLEPPYTVRPGETLESIARQHDVPWQLLAKINGLPPAEPMRPGQQLKVVRGPFEGVLDLRRNQLSLTVDGRYAGKFAVSAASEAAVPPGEWRVIDKPAAPVARPSVYGVAPAGSPTVARSLLLANAAGTAASPGVQIQIGAAAAAGAASGEANSLRAGGSPYVIQVSPRDAEEIVDILSLGSRVVILR